MTTRAWPLNRRQSHLPRLLLSALLLAGGLAAMDCGLGASEVATAPAPAATADLLHDDPTQSLFQRVLALNRIQEPELDVAGATAAYQELLGQVRAGLTHATTPHERVAVLNQVLLKDRSVSYLSNEYWRDATIAASLLRRKGNCLATATLYAVIGDSLSLPIHMVLIPGHAFARWDDGTTRINIETTSQGRELPDDQYLYGLGSSSCTPLDISALHWGSSLENNGVISEMLAIAAMHRRGENHVEDALALMRQSLALTPYRLDKQVQIIELAGDLAKDRESEHQQYLTLLNQSPPPTVATDVLLHLALESSARGDLGQELTWLLNAYRISPKTTERQVLTLMSNCYRSLKDMHAAVCYQQLAVVSESPGSPDLANDLYNLAIMQHDDGHDDGALRSLDQALKINPESWNLLTLQAGYLALTGHRDEALKRYDLITPPRGDHEFFECMHTWFLGVTGQDDAFFRNLSSTLAAANTMAIITWLDQDPDLDKYRKDPRFIDLLRIHRARLLGQPAASPAAPSTPAAPVAPVAPAAPPASH